MLSKFKKKQFESSNLSFNRIYAKGAKILCKGISNLLNLTSLYLNFE